MAHYKIEYSQNIGEKAATSLPKSPKSSRYRRDRIYRCAFKGGRKLGYDQGYAEGFDAGYEKGYTEGSSLGYNNGFFSAIDLNQDDKGISQVALLRTMVTKKDISILVSGEKKQEAQLIFRQLGVRIEKGSG